MIYSERMHFLILKQLNQLCISELHEKSVSIKIIDDQLYIKSNDNTQDIFNIGDTIDLENDQDIENLCEIIARYNLIDIFDNDNYNILDKENV